VAACASVGSEIMTKSQHKAPSGEEIHHPRWQLNEAIHQPVRLSLLSLLAQSQKVDFTFLRDYLELGDSNLSRHLTALEELDYVTIEKVFERKRPRTWIALSPEGRKAFEEYIQVLRQIVVYPLDKPEHNIKK